MASNKFLIYLKFIGFLIKNNTRSISEKYYLYKNYVANGTFLFGNNHIHNASIGKHSYVSFNTIVRNCDIGKYCSIGPNVVIGFGNHKINSLSTHPSVYMHKKQFEEEIQKRMDDSFPRVIIENDVWIGANVYIKNGVVIGNGAVVGAGSVVVSDVPPYAIVGGVPAKIIRFRFDPETIEKLQTSRWWEQDDVDNLNVDLRKFENQQEF